MTVCPQTTAACHPQSAIVTSEPSRAAAPPAGAACSGSRSSLRYVYVRRPLAAVPERDSRVVPAQFIIAHPIKRQAGCGLDRRWSPARRARGSAPTRLRQARLWAGSTLVACAAGGKGRPRPLHPRPGASPLGTPIRCSRMPKRLARMPTGRSEQAAMNACFGITEACAGALIMRQASLAGGLGARCAPSGEREGRSPLADIHAFVGAERIPERHRLDYGGAASQIFTFFLEHGRVKQRPPAFGISAPR